MQGLPPLSPAWVEVGSIAPTSPSESDTLRKAKSAAVHAAAGTVDLSTSLPPS